MGSQEVNLSDLTGRVFDSNSVVDRAFHFASKAHRGQTRSGGEPFIIHPLRVALILKNEMQVTDADTLAICLLHDTVEDSEDVTVRELQEEFGLFIASSVTILTKSKELQRTKNKYLLEEYFETIRNHPNKDIARIKVADRIDNLRDLRDWKPERIAKYIEESKAFVLPLAQSIGDKEELMLRHQIVLSEVQVGG